MEIWPPPPSALRLEGAVHVFCTKLSASEARFSELLGYLSQEERARAAKFYFEKDRRRFTIARGVLRELLGRYLGEDPQTIRFGYGPYGKPFLDRGCATSQGEGLAFNV